MSEQTQTELSKITDGIMAYVGGITGLIQKGEDSAGGQTEDQEPDQPTLGEAVSSMETDGRLFANMVFAAGKMQTRASVLAGADMYDLTQASTRLSQLYSFTREQFYQQATDAVGVRKNLMALKQSIAVSAIQASEEPIKSQTKN